jgi:hypothetical protein
MTDSDQEYWDEEQKQYRPKHRGRIRTSGASDSNRLDEKGELVEIWEGGRFIGYQKTKPDRKGCKMPFHGQ